MNFESKKKKNLTCCLHAVFLGCWAVYLYSILRDALYFFVRGGRYIHVFHLDCELKPRNLQYCYVVLDQICTRVFD